MVNVFSSSLHFLLNLFVQSYMLFNCKVSLFLLLLPTAAEQLAASCSIKGGLWRGGGCSAGISASSPAVLLGFAGLCAVCVCCLCPPCCDPGDLSPLLCAISYLGQPTSAVLLCTGITWHGLWMNAVKSALVLFVQIPTHSESVQHKFVKMKQ